MTDKDWDDIRSREFPVCKGHVYLDHAAGGVISRTAHQAAQTFYDQSLRYGDFKWPLWIHELDQARKTVAAFVGAEADEIAFVANTSTAMNMIAELCHGKGEVIANTLEFPSSTIPWLVRGFKLHYAKANTAGIVDSDAIAKLYSNQTGIIVTSLVAFCNGFRQDIAALGRTKKEHYLVVNASQAAGAVAIDLSAGDVDFLCANSYKWMLAGYGAGFLYVNKKHRHLSSTLAGWLSVENSDRMDNRNTAIKDHASRFEMGGINFAGVFALASGVRLLTDIGMQNIEKRILDMTGYLIERLKKHSIEVLTPEESARRAGIVVFRVRENEKVWKRLIQKKIFVSLRGGGIRVAPHFYNNTADIDTLVEAIAG